MMPTRIFSASSLWMMCPWEISKPENTFLSDLLQERTASLSSALGWWHTQLSNYYELRLNPKYKNPWIIFKTIIMEDSISNFPLIFKVKKWKKSSSFQWVIWNTSTGHRRSKSPTIQLRGAIWEPEIYWGRAPFPEHSGKSSRVSSSWVRTGRRESSWVAARRGCFEKTGTR